MKEFQQEIYNMYFAGMSIHDIAIDVEIDVEEVKDIISLMAGGLYEQYTNYW